MCLRRSSPSFGVVHGPSIGTTTGIRTQRYFDIRIICKSHETICKHLKLRGDNVLCTFNYHRTSTVCLIEHPTIPYNPQFPPFSTAVTKTTHHAEPNIPPTPSFSFSYVQNHLNFCTPLQPVIFPFARSIEIPSTPSTGPRMPQISAMNSENSCRSPQ